MGNNRDNESQAGKKQAIIDQVQAMLASRVSPTRGQQAGYYALAFLRRVPAEELARESPASLAAIIARQMQFVERREPGQTLLRVFNPTTGEWSLYWVDNLTAVLQPPVVGRFHNGRGEFFAHDQHQGTPVLCRFTWDGITDTSARWDQAFSVDDGATWETNWVMEFTRISR